MKVFPSRLGGRSTGTVHGIGGGCLHGIPSALMSISCCSFCVGGDGGGNLYFGYEIDVPLDS